MLRLVDCKDIQKSLSFIRKKKQVSPRRMKSWEATGSFLIVESVADRNDDDHHPLLKLNMVEPMIVIIPSKNRPRKNASRCRYN